MQSSEESFNSRVIIGHCKYCWKPYTSREERTMHKKKCQPPSNRATELRSILGESLYKCAWCNRKFKDLGGVDIHAYSCIKNPEVQGKIQCKQCGKWFLQKGGGASCSGRQQGNTCPNKLTTDGTQLQIFNFHERHPITIITCNWCKRIFETVRKLEIHSYKCRKKIRLQFMERIRKFGKPDMGTCQECETRRNSIKIP